MLHHRMVLAVGSPVISKESYKEFMENYLDGLGLIRQEFEAVEKGGKRSLLEEK
jgi:hypothetical protein